MPALRPVLALIGGIVLYYMGVVLLGGVLAALAVPKPHFAFFGKQNVELALATVNLGTWALPVIAFVGLGSYGLAVLLKGNQRVTFLGIFVGMLACFVYWHLAIVEMQSSIYQGSSAAWLAQFFSTLIVPWWGAPNFVAPWLGLVAGLWFAARRPRLPHEPAV